VTVNLLQVLAAARAAYAPMVGEIAGYLVLGAADQVVGAPRRVLAQEVLLQEDGALRLLGGVASSDAQAELALRGLLRRLLADARSASLALVRASQRPAGAGVGALVRELEAGLIPVNRSAGRRALSRLYRQTARALEAGKVVAQVERVEERSVSQPVAPEEMGDERSAHGADPEVSFCEVEVTLVDADVASRPGDAYLVEVGADEQSLSDQADSCAEALPAELATVPEPVVVRAEAVAVAVRPQVGEATAHPAALSPAETLGFSPELTPMLGSVFVGELPRSSSPRVDAPEEGTILGGAEPDQTDPMLEWRVDPIDPDHRGEQPRQQSLALSAEPEQVCAAERPVEPLAPMAQRAAQEWRPEQQTDESGQQPVELSAEPHWSSGAAVALERSAPLSEWFVRELEPEVVGDEGKQSLPGLGEAGRASSQPPLEPQAMVRTDAALTATAAEPLARPAEHGSLLVQAEPRPVASWLDESLPPDDGWDLPDAASEPQEPGQPAGEQRVAEQTDSQAEPAASGVSVSSTHAQPPAGRDGRAATRPAASAFVPRCSDVRELVAKFSVGGHKPDAELCRDLKSMAGVDATPLPSAACGEK
jgi:hypothetical protein